MGLTSFSIFFFYLAFTNGDRPCARYDTITGSVCVGNSSYVDTISPPSNLPYGQFHLYTTSRTRPGFNHNIGYFRMQALLPSKITITVDTEKTFQVIKGFGGAFTDAFGYNLKFLSSSAQANLFKSYFSDEGIEYNTCRVVLGSCDFSLRDYNYLPKFDPTLKTFNLTEDDHIYKIAPMKKALKVSKHPIKFLGSVWNTPEWIRMNQSDLIGYVKDEYKQLWGDYYMKTMAAFKNEGIDFWAVTTGNEPITLYCARTFLKTMAGVVMFPEEQRSWIINNLGPSLRNNGFNTSIYLLDDMRFYGAWWMDTVLRDPRARNYVSGIGLHWYVDAYFPPQDFDEIMKKYPEQEIIYTESSFHAPAQTMYYNKASVAGNLFKKSPIVGAPILGSWERASEYAADIIQNLRHWVTTYIDWNLALDLNGGPNRIKFPCDAAIIINTTSNEEFYKQPMFYILGHFSKFIPPGSVIINLQEVNNSKYLAEDIDINIATLPPAPIDYNVQYVGARNPNGSLSLILYNPKSVAVEVIVHDPKRGYANLILEANSLNTLVYW